MKRENSGNRSGRNSERPSSNRKPVSSGRGPSKPRTSRPGQGFKKDEGGESPYKKRTSGGTSFEKRAPRGESSFKPRRTGEGDSRGGEKRTYKPRTEGGFKPRRTGDGDSRGGEKRSYTPRTEGGFKPRRTGDGDSRGGEKRSYTPRRTGEGDSRGGEKRTYKPRTEGGFKPRRTGDDSSGGDRPYRPKTDAAKRFGTRRVDGDSRGGRKGLGVSRNDGSVFPENKKKAYGGSEGYAERKEMKSFHDLNQDDSADKKFDRRRERPSELAGKGKFTKKSELKGFRPRISKTESQDDFRFKKPGSRGKQIDLGNEPAPFVSKSKSQSKERVTEEALNVGEAVRLNRFISNAGVCSRREADELIGAGLVSINGEIVTELGTKVKAGDVVRFNGEKLTVEAKVYILLNKPKDAITTADDPEGRNTVMDIFDGKMKERIFPVGRLDRNTTGVLILTNDGELAQRLMHPKYEINKVYKATLNKNLKPADLWALSNGVELEDGFIKPDAIAQSDAKNKNVVGIEIHSGRNRIIHRMFESLGYTVEKLDRVLYAGLEKGVLKRGEWRELNEKELKTLKRSVHLK